MLLNRTFDVQLLSLIDNKLCFQTTAVSLGIPNINKPTQLPTSETVQWKYTSPSGCTHLIVMKGDHSVTVGCLGFGGHSKQRETRVPRSFADNLGTNVWRKLDLVVKEHRHYVESLRGHTNCKAVRSWVKEDLVPTFGHYDNRNIFEGYLIMRATIL